jgi:hypothetical protein
LQELRSRAAGGCNKCNVAGRSTGGAARSRVITVDADDFKVYRRNKREAIPLIVPPVE